MDYASSNTYKNNEDRLMSNNYFVTSISTQYGEHLWSFQGPKQENPKMYAANQAVLVGDRLTARQIREPSSQVHVYS